MWKNTILVYAATFLKEASKNMLLKEDGKWTNWAIDSLFKILSKQSKMQMQSGLAKLIEIYIYRKQY